MPALSFPSQCRVCGHWYPVQEFVGGPVVGFCWRCYERHTAALEAIQSQRSFTCCECQRTAEQIAGGDNRATMRLYQKDGCLALLCERCGPVYERSNAQMFRKTPYGEECKI